MREQLRVAGRKAFVLAISVTPLLCVLFTPETRAERLPIKAYTTADGLAHDSVNRIVQDSKGFLWFCTSEGLSRFDGYKFTNYGTESGLAGRNVYDFLEAHNGVYWVATNRGLCRFITEPVRPTTTGAREVATQRFLVYYPVDEPQSPSNYINAIYEDHAGAIWCCTQKGLFKVEQISGNTVFSPASMIEPGTDPGAPLRVSAVLEDRHRSLWIIAQSGLYRLKPDGAVERYTESDGLPAGSNVLSEDRDGLIWVGSFQGLWQMVADPKPHHSIVARRYTIEDGLASNDVSSICQSSDGTLWVGSSAGLSRLVRGQNGEFGRIKAYTQANGLSHIRSLCEDRERNLWVGTLTAGAMRLAHSGFVTYTDADGLGGTNRGNVSVASIFEDPTGGLYIVGGYAPNLAVSKFEGAGFGAVGLALPHGMTTWGWGWYQVTFKDHTGQWWMPTGQGLVRYPMSATLEQIPRVRPIAVYKTRDGLGADDIFRIFEDSRGDIWISSIGNRDCVLTRWERATETFHRFPRFTLAEGVRDSAPTAFCEDGAGNLWMGFYEGGLLRYAGGRITSFPVADGVPPGFVQGIYLDHAGRLWVATSEGGVCRVDHPADDRPTFVTYSTAEGLSSNWASSIIEDRSGMIYVATGRGVDRLDPAAGLIRHYTTADGLASNWVGVSLRDKNGSLWFGTLLGVSRLDPRPEPPTSPPPILITAFHVAGVPYPISELGATSIAGPELTANRNNIQIEFAGLSFAVGESLRYQYLLEGAASDWSAPSDQRIVNYPNLTPGSYRFLVRALKSDGTLSESPAVASFRILPPIWRRWWFVLAAGALVAAVAYALAHSRISRIRAIHESDRRFRTLAETASDAIITIDEHGRIVLANRAAHATFGHAISDMLGKDLTMLMPEYLRELHQKGLARYKETGVRHISWNAIELVGLHKNGTEIPLEISFGEFTKGDRRFFTGIARDISERKRVEQDRKQAEDALRRSREERLAELERVRTRIATDLHDDIGSSLTQIAILGEVAHQNVKSGDGKRTEPLERIIAVSNELVDTMSDIVWAINPTRDHLSDLIHRMRRFASDVLTARGIELAFDAPAGEGDIALGANLRREVFLIFKETINNIIKHSLCSSARIKLQMDGYWLTLEVSDDGQGFDGKQPAEGGVSVAADSRGGNGIPSMRKRATDMGGEFEIISGVGRGTATRLRVFVQKTNTIQ